MKTQRDYLSPKSRYYIADLLREKAGELRDQARRAGALGAELWEQAKDLDKMANELEEM